MPSVNHVTGSRRVYQPLEMEKDVSKGKELSSDVFPAKEEDDTVLKQLKKTQAQASIWDLLMSTEKHIDTLVRALDDAKIATNGSPCEMIASLMEAPPNAITFLDEDLPAKGRVHNRPLFI